MRSDTMENGRGYNTYAFYAGIAAVLCFSAAWVSAVAVDGNWPFGVEMVSRLGISNTPARHIFNAGAMVSGILAAAFAYLLVKSTSLSPHFLLLMVAGIALFFVGVFDMNHFFHNIAAISLFVIVWISMLFLVFRDMRSGNPLNGYVNAICAATIAMLLVLTPLPFFEAIAIIIMMAWMSWVAVLSLKGEKGYGI